MWAIWVGEELESNPMFGKVERHGKVRTVCPSYPSRVLTFVYRILPDTLFCLTTFTTLQLTLIPNERAILVVW